ncbi:YiiG family protein [Paenibacillus taichungensis]|uniref:YiiG family protein n=1 Tax=Paenibacillus taichungensis TaxID=484184 RepID=UPI0035DC3F7F
MKSWRSITIVLSIIMVLSGCTKHEIGKPNADKVSPNEGISTSEVVQTEQSVSEDQNDKLSEAGAEELKMNKYNAYIMLNNIITGRLNDVMEHYLKTFSSKPNIKFNEKHNYWVRSFVDRDETYIKKAFEFARQEPAFDSLDAAALNLEPSMNKLIGYVKEAHDYYDLKMYVDDQFEKGKQLHNQILSSYDEYEKATEVFILALSKMSEQHLKETMEQLKENDQLLRYSALQFISDANALTAEMEEQGINASNVLDIDMKKFKKIYDSLKSTMESLIQYSSDDTRVQSEGFSPNQLNMFMDNAKAVKVAASEIIERINEKNKVPDYKLRAEFALKHEKGTPEKYNAAVIAAINIYNQGIH